MRLTSEAISMSGQGRSAVPVPSVASCFCAIALIKLAMAVRGFGPTLRWIRQQPAGTPWISVSNDDLSACEYRVAMAAAFFPGRALCLERSLALFYLARRRGIPVTYHHGVQPRPFAAHAWIEHHGRIVNDVPEHVGRYHRLLRVEP